VVEIAPLCEAERGEARLAAVRVAAQAGPRVEKVAASVAAVWMEGRQALLVLGVDERAPGASPLEMDLLGEACHNIRRTYFLAGRICGIWGTTLAARLAVPDCADWVWPAWEGPGAPPAIGGLRIARRLPRSPGSCLHMMHSACIVLFPVHLRQRSYSLLISMFIGSLRRRH